MSDNRLVYLEERVKQLEQELSCRWSNDPIRHIHSHLTREELEECGCRVCSYDLAQRNAVAHV